MSYHYIHTTIQNIRHVTYKELFTCEEHQVFQELWADRDSLGERPLEEIDKRVKSLSGDISIKVFAPGITSAYENRSSRKWEYQRKINLGLNTLMKHLGISCYNCREVVPSWKETWSEDKKILESYDVDPNFKNGRRFSAIHPDHQEEPACGYVTPSETLSEKRDVAEGNLMVCIQKCDE